ncbi:hypothetical protein O181_013794 [Austropuccinia psidii MF-1]|uniref:Uncharacterized protein n=1 Tax=Austropuccinia psidii MF-1 TaxID=1389203 RepID=A0A9Q3BZ02_9BASI|nr:hypothetical protein [Austropuccinia psidii MF-1]
MAWGHFLLQSNKCDGIYQVENKPTLNPIGKPTLNIQGEDKVAWNNPHTQKTPQELKKMFQWNVFTTNQNNTPNIWTEPKIIKTTDIYNFTHMNPTLKHHVVHKEEQKQCQQTPQHMEPQGQPPEHRDDEANTCFFN